MSHEFVNSGQFLHASRTHPDSLNDVAPFTLADDTVVSVIAPGIIQFIPGQRVTPAKWVVYSCGVHGNETAPIEICDALVQDILLGRITLVHPLLVLFGNLPAMDIGKRFVEENMNRLFSGAHSEGPGLINDERRRAKQLEDAICAFFAHASSGDTKYHYDLHTAIRESKNEKFAVYPYLHERSHSRSQLAFLARCGVKTILLSESATTTFSYYSSHQHQAHAFTVELGKVRPFGQNDMQRFAAAKEALFSLVTEQTLDLTVDMSELEIFRVNQVINRTQEDFSLTFADDTPNFTGYPKGTVLARESGNTYIAQQDGEAIVFPNANVALGQRALLTVVPTTLEKLDV